LPQSREDSKVDQKDLPPVYSKVKDPPIPNSIKEFYNSAKNENE
jgi:hypothetical protein